MATHKEVTYCILGHDSYEKAHTFRNMLINERIPASIVVNSLFRVCVIVDKPNEEFADKIYLDNFGLID